ncbi:MAG: nucleotidyltransferase domain-containing protein [Candidatus Thermoplasmatota archaeon]|nr:nucleotidyltransferase domain-containing protein [Candidatus Thermoplasmatota archaeon]
MDLYQGSLAGNALFKIMEWFSRNPGRKVYVNELSKIIQLSNASCSRVLNLLEGKDLLKREMLGKALYFELRDNFATREMKRFFLILRLHESGLVEYLSESNPSMTNLILYGSCATGEYDEYSDMDILAITNDQIKADMRSYQEIMNISIEITSMNIGRWISMRDRNEGFYQEVKKDGIILFGGILP